VVRNAICAPVLIGHRVTSSRISSSVQRDMATVALHVCRCL
jgi:hypothetical protein